MTNLHTHPKPSICGDSKFLLFRFLLFIPMLLGFSISLLANDGEEMPPVIIVFDDMEHGNPFGNGWFAFGGTVGGGGIGPNFGDLPPIDGGAASLETGWGSGGVQGYFGGFGRTNPTELVGVTHFNLWINPDRLDGVGRVQDYVIEINLQDDDNGDGMIPFPPDGNDDEFQYNLTVGPPGSGAEVITDGGWQRISIPLSDFFDDATTHFGGNGVLDAIAPGNGGNGELINIVVAIVSNSGADVTFRTDYWYFTDQFVLPIPTLSQWGIIALALILLIVGVVYLRARKLTPVNGV